LVVERLLVRVDVLVHEVGELLHVHPGAGGVLEVHRGLLRLWKAPATARAPAAPASPASRPSTPPAAASAADGSAWRSAGSRARPTPETASRPAARVSAARSGRRRASTGSMS